MPTTITAGVAIKDVDSALRADCRPWQGTPGVALHRSRRVRVGSLCERRSRLCGWRFCRRRGHRQGLGSRRWPRIASGCGGAYFRLGATTMRKHRRAGRHKFLKRKLLVCPRELGAASKTARSRLPNGRGHQKNGLQALRDRRERHRIARALQGLRDEPRPSVEPLVRHRIGQALGGCGQRVLPRRRRGTHGGVAQRRDDLISRVAVKEVMGEGLGIQPAAPRPGGHRLGQARQQPGPQLGLRLRPRGPLQGAKRTMNDRRQPCREAIGCRRRGMARGTDVSCPSPADLIRGPTHRGARLAFGRHNGWMRGTSPRMTMEEPGWPPGATMGGCAARGRA